MVNIAGAAIHQVSAPPHYMPVHSWNGSSAEWEALLKQYVMLLVLTAPSPQAGVVEYVAGLLSRGL